MCNVEELYKYWFNKLNSSTVKIFENGARMNHLRPNAEGGYFQPLHWEDGILHGEILIDDRMSAEEKLNTLFHEKGHAIYDQQKGKIENEMTRLEKEEELIRSEFFAFRYQLEMMMSTVSECGDKLLRNTIRYLEDRLIEETDDCYRQAISLLQNDPIWSNAKKRIFQ